MEKKYSYELVLDEEFDALNLEMKEADDELTKKYPAKLHARKVVAELAATHGEKAVSKNGIIYLPGEPTREFEYSDMGPRFRQRRYFFYITGVNIADCAVTYEIEREHLTLWIPYVEPRKVLYFGRIPSAAQALSMFDVDEVRYVVELPRFFDINFGPETTLYILNKEQQPDIQRRGSSSNNLAGHIDSTSLIRAMDRARVVKTAHEVALIRRANDVSSVSHAEVAQYILGLRVEEEVEAIFNSGCLAQGAHELAYGTIAGSGPNAAVLHYWANNEPLKGRQLMVLDAGCEWNCYASDITRTLPLNGEFSPEAEAIHSIVQRMQEECIAMVAPGVGYRAIHRHAALVAAEGLLELGILTGHADEVKSSGVASAFFPHGLGHHVGLECHDVAGDDRLMSGARLEGGKRAMVTPRDMVQLLRDDGDDGQLLQPNMIVTIEPGIYFCKEYIEGYFLSRAEFAKLIDTDVMKKYFDVGGIRIEDDILVTEDGYENLTTAPKGQELLDIINGGGKKPVRI